ncbi:MAG: hypothetical protein K2R98_21490 [Gemmataceae bacterium]|nr:hypothetical protein [Gemmataceae bacterium]
MKSVILSLSLALGLAALASGADETPRKPHPFAPSLPLLTDEEEAKIDRIIDRFILFDTGKLTGEEGKKALQDFQKLGPEAIPALIRGMNKAAGIEASCPAVTIGRKLAGMLKYSDDSQLLEFARENIGLGVTKSPHMAVIKDLRTICLLRKRDVDTKQLAMKKKDPPVGGEKSLRNMTTAELSQAATTERGSKLKDILTELEKRPGDLAIAALGTASGTGYDAEIQQLARDLLAKNLSRQTTATLKDKLKDERPGVRVATALVIGDKGIKMGGELIELLNDKEADVQQAARKALTTLAKGTDYGPERDAKDAERAEAIKQWRAWWAKQNSR